MERRPLLLSANSLKTMLSLFAPNTIPVPMGYRSRTQRKLKRNHFASNIGRDRKQYFLKGIRP